ncbi:MAG: family 16 glycosylhydrolase [Fibrobacteres bacterium]|nr:family 16 glycosylhydrolase [Fibrobacterota bacterium]
MAKKPRYTAIVALGLLCSAIAQAKPWKSAELISKETFKYGAFEARVRAAEGSGMITTFFLWKDGSELPGAKWQEQDFEIWGKDGLVQSQAMTPGDPRVEHTAVHRLPTKAWERYYTYRMEWTPKKLSFYIDGTKVREETDPVEFEKLLDPAKAEPAQLRTGLWAGDFAWSGAFDATKVPQASFVNWLQVFDYTPGAGPNGSDFSLRWRDNFDGMNWNRWWSANWTFEYSVSDYTNGNHKAKDGALVSVLTTWQNEGTFPQVPVDDGQLLPIEVAPPAPVLDTTPIAIPSEFSALRLARALEYSAGDDGNGTAAGCVTRVPSVDMETNDDPATQGLCHIGFTDAGEWVEYDLIASDDDLYDLLVDAGSGYGGNTFRLFLDGAPVGSTMMVPTTGWSSFSTHEVLGVPMNQGRHVLRVVFDEGYVNLNRLEVRLHQPSVIAPISIPGRLDATNYVRFFENSPGNEGGAGKADDVDKVQSSDQGGGLAIGYTDGGEWLEYDIDVSTAGKYDFTARMASAEELRWIVVKVDGVAVTGAIGSPSEDWDVYADSTVTGILLSAGKHTVQIFFETGRLNLRYLDIAASAPAIPSVVTGVVATPSDATVQLFWEAVEGATRYKVLRDGALLQQVIGTTATDRTVVNGVTYTYSVVSGNASGDAVPSIGVQARPVAPAAPSAPTGFVATSGNSRVDLVWGASIGATDYQILRGAGVSDLSVIASTSALSYSDASVVNGSSYRYAVRGVNGSTLGVLTSTVAANPRGLAPAIVLGLTATAGNASINLVWPASAGATGYRVVRQSGGTTTTKAVSGNNYVDLSLSNGQAYSYSVVALNEWGEAAPSASVTATPIAPPTATLRAQYKNGNASASTNMLYPRFQLLNAGTTSVDLSKVTIRYWYTSEGNQAQTGWFDYAQIGTANLLATFGRAAQVKTNADSYLQISFKPSAGTLAAGRSTGEIQTRVSKADWSNYNQLNDASFGANQTASFADWSKITVYLDGKLVWGVEP